MPTQIFLSVGRTFNTEQEEFVRELENYLQGNGLIPQTVGRTYFSSQQPLKAIDELMNLCSGTLILAFERTHIETAIDKRGSSDERRIAALNLPTVWNQIEATMAYTRGHPLLVVVEEGLKDEGLLEKGYDWFVKRVKLRREALFDREFVGIFSDWKRRVEAYQPPGLNTVSLPPVSKPAPSHIEPGASKIKILFLTANPTDTNRLRLDLESRAIDQALRKAEYRDRFEFEQYQAVRVTDLQECLLRFEPHIVHFSGHGSEQGEILLEDNTGNSRPVSERALSTLFSVLKDNIRCVFLNACYSERQAQAIAQHIDCVVGMSTAISDNSALSFATAFYQALAYGRDVKTAFDLGCLQIDLENLAEQDTPQFLALHSNPGQIVFGLE